MIEWFEALSVAGKVFVCVAIPSTLILVIQTVMTFFGFGDGGDGTDMPDLDGDGVPDGIFGSNDAGETDNFEVAESSGLHMFSLRGIVAFFCIFGWLGLTMVSNGTEEWLAVLVAFIGGFLAMLGVAFLLKALSKLQSDGTMNIRYAIGASGSVYITVPPQRRSKGKVNLLVQGKLEELDAVTDEKAPLPFGTEVGVTGISGGNTLIVRRK